MKTGNENYTLQKICEYLNVYEIKKQFEPTYSVKFIMLLGPLFFGKSDLDVFTCNKNKC